MGFNLNPDFISTNLMLFMFLTQCAKEYFGYKKYSFLFRCFVL